MSQVFYKIRDTRTGATGYVPDYAWKRTRKLYQVMDLGDLAFMERADDEDYFKTENGYSTEETDLEVTQEEIDEIYDRPINTLTVRELMDIIYDGCRAALTDFENEAYGYEDTPPGPAVKDSPKQVKD